MECYKIRLKNAVVALDYGAGVENQTNSLAKSPNATALEDFFPSLIFALQAMPLYHAF